MCDANVKDKNYTQHAPLIIVLLNEAHKFDGMLVKEANELLNRRYSVQR